MPILFEFTKILWFSRYCSPAFQNSPNVFSGRQIEYSFNDGIYSEDIAEEDEAEAEEEASNQVAEEEETDVPQSLVVSQQHVQSVPEKLSVAENSSKDTIEIKFNANESVHNMQPPTPDTVQNSPRDEAEQNQDNDGPQFNVSTHIFLDSIIKSITVNCINFQLFWNLEIFSNRLVWIHWDIWTVFWFWSSHSLLSENFDYNFGLG